MNRPPEEFVRVQEQAMMDFGVACFDKAGLDREHAQILTRLLVNSDLRGVRTHGSRNINGYCNTFEQGHANPRPDIGLVQQTAATAVLDGDGTLGYLPMVRAAELAVETAKSAGIGMVVSRPIGHYGSAGHYARICMENGCVGFSVQGYIGQGDARGAEEKPQIGYYGNPPISFAIPGAASRGGGARLPRRVLRRGLPEEVARVHGKAGLVHRDMPAHTMKVPH